MNLTNSKKIPHSIDISPVAKPYLFVQIANNVLLLFVLRAPVAFLAGLLTGESNWNDIRGSGIYFIPAIFAAWLAWKNVGVINAVRQRFTVTSWIVLSLGCAMPVVVYGVWALHGGFKHANETEFKEIIVGGFVFVFLSVCSLSAAFAIVVLRRVRIDELNCKLVDFVDYALKSNPHHHLSRLPSRNARLGLATVVGGFAIIFGLDLLPTELVYKNSNLARLFDSISGLSSLLLLYSRGYFQPTADILLSHDNRDPVLFLRSFVDDEKIGYAGADTPIFDVSLESRLAEYFARVGPFIAVGAPQDKLPAIGAARASLSDAQWQGRVLEWMDKARIILVMAGVTRCIGWEMQQVVGRGHAAKMIMLFPQGRRRIRIRRFWSKKIKAADRLATVQEAFSHTPWAPALRELRNARRIRSIVFHPDGSVTVVGCRSRSRNSYHLAALIGHYLLPAAQAGSNPRPIPAIQRSFDWKAAVLGIGVAALSVVTFPWSNGSSQPFAATTQRATQFVGYAMVNPDKLVLKGRPSEAGEAVAVLPEDLEVRVIREVRDGWDEIEAPGPNGTFFRGYVNGHSLTITATTYSSARFIGYAAVNFDRLALRAEPSKMGKVVAVMPKNLQVKIIREAGNGWEEIEAPGSDGRFFHGYVNQSLLFRIRR